MTYRWAQQIRLWIYVIVLILSTFQSFTSRFTFVDFIVFMLVAALFYLEICPKCGRLAWMEKKRWPNALWISSRCRREASADLGTGDTAEE